MVLQTADTVPVTCGDSCDSQGGCKQTAEHSNFLRLAQAIYLRVQFISYVAFLNVKLTVLHRSCTLPRRRLTKSQLGRALPCYPRSAEYFASTLDVGVTRGRCVRFVTERRLQRLQFR